MRLFYSFLLISISIVSCKFKEESQKGLNTPDVSESILRDRERRPYAKENGKFFKIGERQYLYGGKDSAQHFDISNLELKPSQFHYGIGREAFPALLDPVFINKEQADMLFVDSTHFLLLNMDSVVKAYSIKDLTRHEVVNDEINGKPIMAAYCILADLGAIYDRTIEGKEFTFGLSGYTYFDNSVWDGMDGFVMWDRETESLWWPLIGKAVSGRMKGTKMNVLPEKYWEQTTWGNIKSKYSTVQVLRPGQDFSRPKSWPKYGKDVFSDSLSTD